LAEPGRAASVAAAVVFPDPGGPVRMRISPEWSIMAAIVPEPGAALNRTRMRTARRALFPAWEKCESADEAAHRLSAENR